MTTPKANMFGAVYRGTRVLVTGHTGFKGAWLSEWLLHLGADVSGFANGVPYSPSLFDAIGLRGRMRHREGDIRDFDAVRAALRDAQPAIVFHLAAQPLVRRSYDEPRETFDTNVGGTVNVLEAVRQVPSVRAAVIVTTDKCYENRGQPAGYRETDRLGGEDPYSASKACAELATHAYQQSFFRRPGAARVSSARAGNVIGGGDWAEDRIVPDCVRAWSAGRPAIVRNPSYVRPWQHVLEPVSGYLLLGQSLLHADSSTHGEAFNFGPTDASSDTVETLVGKMAARWPGAAWKSAGEAGDHKTEAAMLKLNCEKAMERLGWRPLLSLDECVRLTVDWYRSYYDTPSAASDVTTQQIVQYHERAAAQQHVWA